MAGCNTSVDLHSDPSGHGQQPNGDISPSGKLRLPIARVAEFRRTATRWLFRAVIMAFGCGRWLYDDPIDRTAVAV